ncbi:uncharacterized protein A4U43_C07F38050 [Asparagus officinalis]|uniref:Uncharacterized protein n=1 Tax=Asparagus officinalis TaxID=4686 RepID=A0A5P1ENB8_ASPOF|nr:uncharacterized protein A4U43_C07F38050 [Asparagus officinalis]
MPSSPRGANGDSNCGHHAQKYMKNAEGALLNSCSRSPPHTSSIGFAYLACIGSASPGGIARLFAAHQKGRIAMVIIYESWVPDG